MKRKIQGKEQSGQGTIEMVMCLFAFFTIFFMYTQVALSLAVGNYYQYATFMAARAYHSAYLNPGDQLAAANTVLTAMIKPGAKERFSGIATGVAGAASAGNPAEIDGGSIGGTRATLAPDKNARNTAWEQGVAYAFKVKMYMAPLLPGISTGEDSKLTLESQTWLGREPTQVECEAVLFDRQSKSNIKVVPIYDNGC